MAARRRDLSSVIPAGASVLVDTSVVLAYLGGSEPGSEPARQLFDGFVATGRNPGSISAVTVGEILVRPFQRGSAAVATAEGFLRHFSGLSIVTVTYQVAREAASLRAPTGLAMPDALIIASARTAGIDLIVTGDRSWRSRLAAVVPETKIVEIP